MAAVAARAVRIGGCGRCTKRCCFCVCRVMWWMLKWICVFIYNLIWLVDGVLRTYVIDPIFVQPIRNFLDRKRDEYNLDAEDTALIDDYFIKHDVGDSITIRQYLCIYVPSSFCPCCFLQEIHVPYNLCCSRWITEGTVENRTLKNIISVIFCAILAIILQTWFRWSGTVLLALFLSGIMIAFPVLRLTVLLFVVSLFHRDGQRVLIGLLHFFLITGPSMNIFHNWESILYVVTCTIIRAFHWLMADVVEGLAPFMTHIRDINKSVQKILSGGFSELKEATNFIRAAEPLIRGTDEVISPFVSESIPSLLDRFFKEWFVACSVKWEIDNQKPRLAVGRAFRQGRDAIAARLRLLTLTIRFFAKVYISVTFWLIYKVTLYIYRYSRDMTYDNIYITAETEFRDNERRKLGLPTVLPLEAEELMKFIDFKSLQMTWAEMVGSFRVGFAAMNFIIIHLINVAVFTAANALYGLVKLEDNDTGSVWSIFIRKLHTDAHGKLSEFNKCLREPRAPDQNHFDKSIVIISLSVVLAIISPYIIRLRPLIANLYLPRTASRRSVWFYNLLLRRREIGPFLAEVAESAKRTLWHLPILWEMIETSECVRCLCAESNYALLFRCYRCDRKNCSYCIHYNRDCGSCGAVMPYSPLGLEEELQGMKRPGEIRAQETLV